MAKLASPLGVIPEDRMAKVPGRFRPHHEFCFHLHDSMLHMFYELAAEQFPTVKLEFSSEQEAAHFADSSSPIDFLMDVGELGLAKKLTVGQAMMAVLGDFFNFIYEALTALEKRKFVVFYALLRKPLKENLLYLTMMFVDDEEFFSKLRDAPGEKFNHPGVSEKERRLYFKNACDKIKFPEFLNPEVLHDIIFDMNLEDGLAPLFDKAPTCQRAGLKFVPRILI